MKILRSVAAIVIGAIVAVASMMLLHAISYQIFGPSEPIDFSDKKAMQAHIDTMPAAAFSLLLATYAAASFLGGITAALIAVWARVAHAGVIGALLLAGTILNFKDLKHPDWVVIVGLLLPLPMSLVAGWVITSRTAQKLPDSSP